MGIRSINNLTIDNSISVNDPLNKNKFITLAKVSNPINWIFSSKECLKFLVTSSTANIETITKEKYKWGEKLIRDNTLDSGYYINYKYPLKRTKLFNKNVVFLIISVTKYVLQMIINTL